MFRFTIRDVLWLTTLVAVLGAWWVDRGSLSRESDRWKKLCVEYAFALRGEGWFVEGREETAAERDERFRKMLGPYAKLRP